MKTNIRRFALLTGVSVAALGVSNVTATAALASPQGLGDGIYPGGSTNATTIEICELANNPTGPTPPCFFGEIETGSTFSDALVNSVANGQAAQYPNAITATMNADGLAEFGAYATAEATNADARAEAYMEDVLEQGQLGGGSADYLLDVDGTLIIEALASAEVFGATGTASAYATVTRALDQFAIKSGEAFLDINNDGVIAIGADAFADAPDFAYATANNGNAIRQLAIGSTAEIDFDNNGTLDIYAIAVAQGSDALADAWVGDAIEQYASGTNGAAVDFVNGAGDLVNVLGYASAVGTKSGTAVAEADVEGGLRQYAQADSGIASVGLLNGGTIQIAAVANATGAEGATASAYVSDAIVQEARGEIADLTNSAGGTIFIGAEATAAAKSGEGSAYATVDVGIHQLAVGTTSADVDLVNNGDIVISAVARVGGGEFVNDAGASIENAIWQQAYATGDVSASLINNGSIIINALAEAYGTEGGTGGNSAAASAAVFGEDLIVQHAATTATLLQVGGNANVLLDNGAAGVIDANFTAIADGRGEDGEFAASAYASVDGFIQQTALAGKSGTAAASLLNEGSITLDVNAVAKGIDATATPDALYGQASAHAFINGGIEQQAAGKSGATAYITNGADGVISIQAAAIATGGPVYAEAIVNTALAQQAGAKSGDAFATILNDGAIDIGAFASVVGDAQAVAVINGAMYQSAIAGYETFAYQSPPSVSAALVVTTGNDANVTLVNNGTINIHATALAHDTVPGGAATADAQVNGGIDQFASATSGGAGVEISGVGSIDIRANAYATADAADAFGNGGGAYAYATINDAIDQEAISNVYGIASAFFSQGGGVDIVADANANGVTDAHAYASIDGVGIEQDVESTGTTSAFGIASVVNPAAATINIIAAAEADATEFFIPYASANPVFGHGYASANVDVGIGQWVDATAVGTTTDVVLGDVFFDYYGTATAVALVDNDGIINVGAIADAAGYTVTAHANVGDGIIQIAQAEGGDLAQAYATLLNDLGGEINVFATAVADGIGSAYAYASVGGGIDQHATAFAVEGTAVAEASLLNNGDILVVANADAAAFGTDVFGDTLSGYAYASAYVGTGIHQYAYASGTGLAAIIDLTPVDLFIFEENEASFANASLVNSGSIVIAANAGAAGDDAEAHAYVDTGILQGAVAYASFTASAVASLDNATGATIAVMADAVAVASDNATAIAGVGVGIEQYAYATAKSGTANASALLDNDGLIAVNADAYASGNDAYAFAGVGAGVVQVAYASGTTIANAHASLANDGTIAVTADATATGGASATAVAVVGNGIVSVAVGNGTSGAASATLVNGLDGVILVGADASAVGSVSASAIAGVHTGILQGALGADLGYATIDNDGSIAIIAEADAGGDEPDYARAYAYVSVGIEQVATADATGGAAIANIDNTGSILVLADADGANASEGSAWATAFVGTGINQFATAYASANAGIDNVGSIDVIALASATADDDAGAFATINTVVYQQAVATGLGGYATADLVNSGTIVGLADATVLGGDTVSAYAIINNGIHQVAVGDGAANASLVNDNYITMIADADGVGGGDGLAIARAQGGTQFAYSTGGSANVAMTNNGEILVSADADILVGNAALKGASASAFATAIGWQQTAQARDVTKTGGTIAFTTGFDTATATPTDTLTGVGYAYGSVETNSPTGPASASIVNTGVMVVQANASAIGDDDAVAIARAVGADQYAGGTSAVVSFVNDAGTAAEDPASLVVLANAYASADNGAYARASATGIRQTATANAFTKSYAEAGTGTIHFTTVGGDPVTELTNINASAYATSLGSTLPTGRALVSVVNTGSILVAADAQANVTLGAGDGVTAPAWAQAWATGIDQFARGAYATAEVDNQGYITVLADAVANGATAAAASASAYGVIQGANAQYTEFELFSHYGTVTETTIFGHVTTFLDWVTTDFAYATANVGAASVFLDNSGSILVQAAAEAIAGSTASASAYAAGVVQYAAGTVASASVVNTGEIDVLAAAYASGTSAYAFAGAAGVSQSLSGTSMNANFSNSGDFSVIALAEATGTTGSATAQAVGLTVEGNGGGSLNVNAYNGTGEFFVGAEAIAPGGAYASAQGIAIHNDPSTVVVGTDTVVLGNPVSGYITNDGTMEVLAVASGGTFTTTTTGGATITIARSSANATGIWIASGVNTMTINNNGLLDVTAVTTNGGPATARGIYVTANGDTVPLVGEVLTINNDGDIIVRQSTDGGDTFYRGMAIDVATAPNNTVINLLSGNIFGNIDVQTGDAINVIVDETVFDGIINPECMPAGGPTALVLDDPDQNLCGEGDMTLALDGNFHMVINPLEGPSYAFVNTLTVEPDGTLELDLPGADGTAPIGTYPQIFADVVTLNGGTLIANIQTPNNGLYETTTYENVIDGLDLSGEFDQCIVTGVPGSSLLLDFGCVYDNLNNVDLKLTRVPFDQVPGLNDNGTSVGEGLECIYDVGLTGGIADMLADLFLFSDPVNFNTALNQLSGSVYANYLQSFPSLGVHHNDILAKATDCEIPALAGSVLECRASSPLHLWGQADYQWRKSDGDEEAGTAKSKRGTLVVGLDHTVGGAGIIGASIGYVTNNVHDNQFGDDADAGGFQVGLYGVYDPGTFYVKAMTTYSWYDGDSSRNINFSGLAPGASFAASPNGDPDVNMWTFGLHGGMRIGMGGNSVLTPYLNYDYVNAKLKEFIETGGNGADLHIDDSSAKHSFLTAGVKWATQMGGVVPEVNLGYRHRFGDTRSEFGAAFLCQTDTACEFDIISAKHNAGTFLAGVSVGGKMGPVDLRIGYEGEFNSDITSHAANFKFVLPLGGRAAPPPPPPVVAPPPPPPPPPVEEAPPPPPPPPPPAPERGQ